MAPRIWWIAGCLIGLMAVAGGAFGAHGLRDSVTAARLETWNTGAEYAMYHAIALLSVGWLGAQKSGWDVDLAGAMLATGVGLFTGSLWLLVLLDVPALGAITPLGGTALLVGWLLCARAGWRRLGPRP